MKRRLVDLAQILMIAGAAFAAGAAAAGDLEPLIAFTVSCLLVGGVVLLARLFPRDGVASADQRARWPDEEPEHERATAPPAATPGGSARSPKRGGPPPPPRYTQAHGTRVLVVDDDESVRKLVARTLGRYGFDVESAPDAALALQLIKDIEPPQMLLTELVLPGPGLTGPALRDRVAVEAPDLAVVFMTGFTGAAKERYGLRPGIDAVVEKPFEAAELLAAVEEALTIQEERSA